MRQTYSRLILSVLFMFFMGTQVQNAFAVNDPTQLENFVFNNEQMIKDEANPHPLDAADIKSPKINFFDIFNEMLIEKQMMDEEADHFFTKIEDCSQKLPGVEGFPFSDAGCAQAAGELLASRAWWKCALRVLHGLPPGRCSALLLVIMHHHHDCDYEENEARLCTDLKSEDSIVGT